jgi:1-phosphofructokinase family hexose kinase
MEKPPKILCISVNPALDRRITVQGLAIGEVNRALEADPAAGGKAAHVAFVARTLGADVRWMAFLGGPDGESCKGGIHARGVFPVPVPISGRTRTNLEVIDSATGKVTEILEPGPKITSAERASFLVEFEAQLREEPTVVLSGSLPDGLEPGFYGELVKLAKNAGCRVLLDTSGAALSSALDSAPDLIKPNRQEASALLGRQIQSVEDALAAARDLRARGVKTVIVSIGDLGAVIVDDQVELHCVPPAVNAVSTVGSGDSFLAGWAVSQARGLPPGECLRMAIACGTANCLAKSPGIISLESVQQFLPQIQIRNCHS